MVIRKGTLLACLGLAVLLAACSGGEKKPLAQDTEDGGTVTSGTPKATALPTRTPVLAADAAEKPCSVLTNDELKAAAGGAVLRSEPTPDKVQPFCRWHLEVEGQSAPAMFEVVAASLANTTLFNASGPGKQAVSGLGDEAYAELATGSGQGTGLTLWVRSGSKTLRIYLAPQDQRTLSQEDTRKAFNDRALSVATALAKIALSRI